jgi:hypothetical protein
MGCFFNNFSNASLQLFTALSVGHAFYKTTNDSKDVQCSVEIRQPRTFQGQVLF